MRFVGLFPVPILTIALALPLAGCGDGRPSRVPVAGTVTIDGQPLAYGSIMLIPDGSRPSTGVLDAQGHFTLSTFTKDDGAVVGHHRVKVTGLESIDEHTNRWHAPKKYANDRTSGIEVEITQPVDDLKIELSWDGGKPFVEHW
jgi:hypothetical protein